MPRTVDVGKRNAVLDAAAKMFLERGYEGVTIDAVADAAGVARRTVYNRFKSKDALFAAVAEHIWSGLSFASNDPGRRDRNNARQAITEIVQAVADYWRKPQALAFLRLIVVEGGRFPQLANGYVQSGKLPIFRTLVTHLSALAERGVLMSGINDDPELAAKQLVGLVNEALLWPRLLGAPEADAVERERVIGAAVTTFLARYGTPPYQEDAQDE